jgi:hypothetical protein
MDATHTKYGLDDLDDSEDYNPIISIEGRNISKRINNIRGFGYNFVHNYVDKFMHKFVNINWEKMKKIKLPISDESFYSLVRLRDFNPAFVGVLIEIIIQRLFCEKLKINFDNKYISDLKYIRNTAKYKTSAILDDIMDLTYEKLIQKYGLKLTYNNIKEITAWLEARPINHLITDLEKVVAGFKNVKISNFRYNYNLSYKFVPVILNGVQYPRYPYKIHNDKIIDLGTCDIITGNILIDIKVAQTISNADKLNLAIQAALINESGIRKINQIGIINVLEKQLYMWSISDWSNKEQKKLLEIFFCKDKVSIAE